MEWLLHLPAVWMGLIIFGTAYLIAAVVFLFWDYVGLTIWLEIHADPRRSGLRYDDVATVN